jgi:copper chaperone CopZ
VSHTGEIYFYLVFFIFEVFMRTLHKLALALTLSGFPSTVMAEEIQIKVKGMVCAFCAQGIKKTFSRMEKVETVEADMNQKIVVVRTKEGETLEDSEIESLIKDAGYNVESIKRKED